MIAGIGLLLAAVGVALALDAPAVAVYADGSTIHFGGSTLQRAQHGGAAGALVYAGDVALVLVHQPDGSIRASASAVLNGREAHGVCMAILGPGPMVERCSFIWGVRSLTAVDHYDPAAHVWRREFGDGAQATLAVPAGADLVPIPLPLGHA